MTNIAKRYALITGASQGIGLAIARKFNEIGYTLILISKSEKIKHTLNCTFNDKDHRAYIVDVRKYEEIKNMYKVF